MILLPLPTSHTKYGIAAGPLEELPACGAQTRPQGASAPAGLAPPGIISSVFMESQHQAELLADTSTHQAVDEGREDKREGGREEQNDTGCP